MSEYLCAIRNSNLMDSDLFCHLKDISECRLDQVGAEYRITVDAFYRNSTLLPKSRSRLSNWVLKQHDEGNRSLLIAVDVLKTLGFGRY